MLDVKRLIGEVSAQNGIRLEPNDPAFALVTLNQLVLEETANRLFEQVSAILAQFSEALSKGEHLAGKTLAQEVKAVAADIRNEWAAGFHSAKRGQPVKGNANLWWLGTGTLSGAALTVVGFALYRMIVG
jgi:hypothetical protein